MIRLVIALILTLFLSACAIFSEAGKCPDDLMNMKGPFRLSLSQVQEFYTSLSGIIDPSLEMSTLPPIFRTVDRRNSELLDWEQKQCKTIRTRKFPYIIRIDPVLGLKLRLKKTRWENKFLVKVSIADLVKMKSYLNEINEKK